MAFRNKTSKTLNEARERLNKLKTIDPALDLGNGLTAAAYLTTINQVQTALDAYNALLTQADGANNTFNTLEKTLRTLSSRMLAAVGVIYGKDSNEYEMAGGTRSSEIDYNPPKPPSVP